MEKKKALLGAIVGIISGIIIMNITTELLGTDTVDWTEVEWEWEDWLFLVSMYIVPILVGVFRGIADEPLWTVVLFPFLVGVLATVLAFLVGAVIELCISGDILLVIAGIGLFMALAAPVGRILVIFFE